MATGDSRRRGCSPPAAASSSPYFPPDLIPEIARRLTSLEDFFALRASCRAYRALLPLTASNLASQAPLLVIYHAAIDSLALFNISLRRCLRFRLSEVSVSPRRFDRFHSLGCRFHSLGCRVAVSNHVRDLRILHPFTGEEAFLPRPPNKFSNVVLSGDLVFAWGYWERTIQYCRLQGAEWRVASIGGSYDIEDLIIVNGTLYVLVSSASGTGYRLAVVQLSDNSNSVELEFIGGQLDARALDMHETSELYFFLAQCCGELILVLSFVEYHPKAYHLFRWNSEAAKWARITSLGGCTLFFAEQRFAGCLGPDHPGIPRDCIYATEDEDGWSEYSSIDGCFGISDHVDLEGQLRSVISPSCWVLPSMY